MTSTSWKSGTASSFTDVVFFDSDDRFDSTDSSDKLPQSELLGSVDSRLFRFSSSRRSGHVFFVSLDASEFCGSDDDGEGHITSFFGSYCLTYQTSPASCLTVVPTKLVIEDMSSSLSLSTQPPLSAFLPAALQFGPLHP